MIGLNYAFGDTLRRIRQEQGKTLRQVCSVSHVSIGHLSDVERGTTQPSFEVIEEVANGLNLSLVELMREVYEYLEEQNTCKN